MFVHARAPFQRRNLAKEWVRMGRTLRFASLVELTHTLLQPFVFLGEITRANLQFFHARTVARKGSVGCQDMTDARPNDSAEQGALGDEFSRGHFQGCTAMCQHLCNIHLSPLPLRSRL